MTIYYATELAPRNAVPVGQVDGSVVGGHVRVRRATIPMINPAYQTTDTIVVALPDIGDAFLYGVINADVTMGSTTIAIGITGTTGKYRAATTFAAAAPTLFGASPAGGWPKLTAVETIFLTLAAAALPTTGTLTVDTFWAQT